MYIVQTSRGFENNRTFIFCRLFIKNVCEITRHPIQWQKEKLYISFCIASPFGMCREGGSSYYVILYSIMLFKKRCSIINFPLFWRKCCQRQKIHRLRRRDTALLVVFHHLSPISFAVVHSFSVVGFDKWSCPNPGNIICSHEIKADDSHHLQYPPPGFSRCYWHVYRV